MALHQQVNKFDMTHILKELANGQQWAYVCHLIEMAEGRHGEITGQPLPSANIDVVAVFQASISHATTVYHILQSAAAKAATPAEILLMLTEAVAAGSSQYVQHLRALPQASRITAAEVANCCADALQQQMGIIDDTQIQPGRRDPRLIFELTRMPGAAQISPKQLGQLLQSSVITGGCLDVEALASLPAAMSVSTSTLVCMTDSAAATRDRSLQHAVQEFVESWQHSDAVAD